MTNLLPVLPAAARYGFSIHKKPTFASAVAEAVTGREVTSARQAYPLWEFELTYEVLRDFTQNQTPDFYFAAFNEYSALLTAFLVGQGQAQDFYYDDLSDDTRVGQIIGHGDEVSVLFPILRTWGVGTTTFNEPVGGIDVDSTITVYIDGTPLTPAGNWSIDPTQQYVVFVLPPAGCAVISVDFKFFYRCRFLEDVVDFEEILHNLWQLKALKFRSVKLGSIPPLVYPPPTFCPVPSLDQVAPVVRGFHGLATGSNEDFSGAGFPTLTTLNPFDVIVVALLSATTGGGFNPQIIDITSTSGLSFSRVARENFADGSSIWNNLEIWVAEAAVALTAEAFTVSFDHVIGSCIYTAFGITGAKLVGLLDPDGSNPATDGAVSPSFPVVTISTGHTRSLVIFATGGAALIRNWDKPDGTWTGVLSGADNGHSPFSTVVVSVKSFSSRQTGLVIEPGNASSSRGEGPGIALAIDGATV